MSMALFSGILIETLVLSVPSCSIVKVCCVYEGGFEALQLQQIGLFAVAALRGAHAPYHRHGTVTSADWTISLAHRQKMRISGDRMRKLLMR